MRDPKRINRILAKIKAAWKDNPDLRLGQLICNAAIRFEQNPYYYEDDDLEDSLKFYQPLGINDGE